MILEFSVKNFLSFKDKVTFSMLGNASDELINNYVIVNDKKILKTAAIYGANASGKSNLFKILSNVVKMLKHSNNISLNAKLPIIPFKFDKISIHYPSEFEIKFIVDNIRYVYGFKADVNIIYEEYLYYYPNGRETKIFDRINGNEYSYSQKDTKFLKGIESKTAPNKFFLATATIWNYEKTKPAYDFLTSINICFNINELNNIAFNIYDKEGENIKSFVLDFLSKTDFNIEDYKVSKVDIPQEILASIPNFITKNISENPKAFQILFKHKNSDNYLDFNEESLGTQLIFVLIPFILNTLNNSGILVIDELDKSLHPILVEYIIQLFNNPEVNKNNSQLIFNTHDTNLLNLNIFRRDQIWFTEKNSIDGISDLYCLNDFSVRKTGNIEKGYMLGRYGAIPFIKNDLNLDDGE